MSKNNLRVHNNEPAAPVPNDLAIPVDGRPCTYLDEPQQRRKRRQKQKQKQQQQQQETALTTSLEPPETKLTTSTSSPHFSTDLSISLGLHPTTHFKYIGPGSLHEDLLLDFIEPSFRAHNDQDASKFCRVAEGVTFLARADATAHLDAGNDEIEDDDTAAVERLVHPHGPSLIDLYFRIVHPSYPILHKQIFLEQYCHASVVPAPLLAAVYLLALDWWEYDVSLGQGHDQRERMKDSRSDHKKPDGEALARIATQSLGATIQRPKLSTVQACLLLLQRGATTGNDSWVSTSQLAAVAEELGLHVDCSNWSIPAWEKGLRRRLAWAAFMQDKWSSLIYGRPSHVQAEHWRIPQLDLDDFGEDGCPSENETDDDVLKGRLLFIHLARLTDVMAEALATFYSHDPQHHAVFSASDGMQTVALVKPVALRLRAWATALPSCLRMEAVRPHKLCSNGYLHLAYFVTEIMVYRCIVRSLARKPLPDVESAIPPPALVNLCREAAKTRLLHVMRFVEALRPEHLQAFWWFASAKSLAYIRTYVSMLWATSPNAAEAELYRQKLDEFRWSLRVRARGVAFVTAALRDMGESLEDIDMSSPPFERRVQAEVKKRELRSGTRLSRTDTGADGAKEHIGEPDTPVVTVGSSTPTDSLQNLGVDMDHLSDFDEMVLQTTPEFLADFGVDASEAFFADINSLQLSMDGT